MKKSRVLYNHYFNPFLIFIFLFKKIYSTIKINFILSIKYKSLKEILNKISYEPAHPTTTSSSTTCSTSSSSVLKTIRYTSIPFYKYNYNKILHLILNKLLNTYHSYHNTYSLYIRNLPIKTNLSFFIFVNLFYFKVRNY
jgi:uncharacterized protein (UPF0248 family)